MAHARLLEIAQTLDGLAWSLNDGLLGQLAEEVQAIAQSLDPEEYLAEDATWLKRQDLKESLEQVRRGEGTVRIPKQN